MATENPTPSTYAEFTEQLGQTLVEQIERSREAQTQALGQVRESLSQMIPNAPQMALPRLEWLPTPQAFARANFALAQTVMNAQREYLLGLFDSLVPEPEKAAESAEA